MGDRPRGELSLMMIRSMVVPCMRIEDFDGGANCHAMHENYDESNKDAPKVVVVPSQARKK